MKHQNIFSLLSVLLVTLSACDKERVTTPTDHITATIAVNTRAGMTTDHLVELGFFATNPNSVQHSYQNVWMKRGTDGIFAPTDSQSGAPIMMLWQNKTTPIDVIAYAPYSQACTVDSYASAIRADQSTESNLVLSDLVYQRATVNPATDLTASGTIPLSLDHALAKLDVSIDCDAIINELAGPHNPVSSISIEGSKIGYIFDPGSGDIQNTGAAVSVVPLNTSPMPFGGRATYEAILVPQTIAASQFEIGMDILGETYTYTLPDELILAKNTRYSLSIRVTSDKMVIANIQTTPWDATNDEILAPDWTQKISINTLTTVIPDSSVLDIYNNNLKISHRGGVATIDLEGQYDKILTISNPDPRLTIVGSSQTKYQNQQLTITATQPWEGKGYSVQFRLAHALFPATQFMDFEVSVMTNAIPSVEIGQLEVMAYNGCGRSPDLYPPLEINQTVRDVYRKQWRKYSANCMWGDRVPPILPLIYPWEMVRTLNSKGGTIIGESVTTWGDESLSIPCPEGWRVPTLAELGTFWPNHNTSAIGQYTKGGMKFTAAIEDSGADEIVVDTITISPKIYVIAFDGGELIFPITGWRKRDDYAGRTEHLAIGAGNVFNLWGKNKGSTNWTASIVGINSSNISLNGAMNLQEAFAEAYNGIRCVRSKK